MVNFPSVIPNQMSLSYNTLQINNYEGNSISFQQVLNQIVLSNKRIHVKKPFFSHVN